MKKHLFTYACRTCLVVVTPSVSASDVCKDGTCRPPAATAMSSMADAHVPVCAVTPVGQGPRLDTLAEKTIAIVGGSFMASVTHPELKRIILKEYPTAKIVLLNEIGSAGPYPRPGIVRREKDEFQRKLKKMKIDAVISGNGGCGLCTPKEAGSCIAAEMMGIPSVMIAGPGFDTQAKSTARSVGIEKLRIAGYPGAFASHTREELIENTRNILWPQIRKALTEPLTDADAYRPDSGFVSDGLPTVPVDKEAVREFLEFTDMSPDHSLGAIPPAMKEVRVRHVAVLGVTAGCPAEFMPILLAFTEAMKNGDFRRTLTSTHGWTPYCWLNGPVARQLGFDSGQGTISGEKNVLLGRFINLAMINFGGYRIKENRMGTFGYPMPWTIAENEEAAVNCGWAPYHVQQGYALSDSTLTAASAINWGNNLSPATTDATKIKDMIAWDAVEKQQMALGSGMPCTYRTFLITPDVARDLSAKYATKESLEKAIVETARSPLGSRAFANYWGNPGSAQQKNTIENHTARIAQNENAEETSTPPWLEWTNVGKMKTVPVMKPGKSAFLVTGDAARNKEMCLPGGAPATVKITLPRNWDKLMSERGFKPLSSFVPKTENNRPFPHEMTSPEPRETNRPDCGKNSRSRPRRHPRDRDRKRRRMPRDGTRVGFPEK